MLSHNRNHTNVFSPLVRSCGFLTLATQNEIKLLKMFLSLFHYVRTSLALATQTEIRLAFLGLGYCVVTLLPHVTQNKIISTWLCPLIRGRDVTSFKYAFNYFKLNQRFEMFGCSPIFFKAGLVVYTKE